MDPNAKLALIKFEHFINGTKVGEGSVVSVRLNQERALIETPQKVSPDARMIIWICAPSYTMLAQGTVAHSQLQPNGLFFVGLELTDVIEGKWVINDI